MLINGSVINGDAINTVSQSTGVVPVGNYSGCASITGEIQPGLFQQGNGVLLWNGQAILTAAHIVYDYSAEQYQSIVIAFNSDEVIDAPVVVDIIIHPEFVVGEGNYDLAVILLKYPVSTVINRYDLYNSFDEIDKIFTRFSYSVEIDPITGAIPDPLNFQWHYSTNRYEAYSIRQNEISGFAQVDGFNTQLIYDYDNNSTVRDALGGLLSIVDTGIIGESGLRPGDSGAAAFINGQIAGVASSITSLSPYDTTAYPDGTIGEINNDMRVSKFVEWISTIANSVSFPAAVTSLPDLSLYGYGGAIAEISLPIIAVASMSGGIGSGTFKPFILISKSTVDYTGYGHLILPSLRLQSSGDQLFSGGYAHLVLDDVELSAYSGGVGQLVLDNLKLSSSHNQVDLSGSFHGRLPALLLASSSSLNLTGEAHPVIADLLLSGYGSGYAYLEIPVWVLSTTAPNNGIIAMNTHTGECTRYTSLPFSTIMMINGKPFGVSKNGLYLMEGDTDNGVDINGMITGKDTDFGSFQSKRVAYIYLNSDTPTKITPYVDSIQKITVSSSFGGRKAKMALGNSGRYWQFKIENINALQGIEIIPSTLQRRVK